MGEIKSKKKEKIRLTEHSRLSRANRRGVTLMELLISVFIFSLVMITVVALFTRFVTFQKRSQAVQRNMEDARFAMELMAKTLRTSSVLSPAGNSNSIDLYDYSQQKCIKYSFSSSKINSQSASEDDKADCGTAAFSSVTPMVGNSINNMTFSAVPSTLSPSVVGQVTISMVICSNNSACSGTENDRAALQTTVSLRDYQESNP